MKFKTVLATLSISSALLLGACGNGDGSSAGGANGSSDGLSGSVSIDGSSTVFPIMEAVSEEYAMEQPDVKAPVGVSGTGGGFEKFINGETDISNASRPIKEDEIKKLEEAGIEYTEFEIAYDGLSVIVNKENDFVDNLTVEELQKMWLESGNVKTWADVREGWPEEEIKFFSPGTDSGTYDYWNEVILEDEQIRRDATLSEDDNVLVQGVTGDKNSIGYFGFAYYIENKDNLKVVPVVNSKGEAVTPDHETIMTGEYEPLSRPMYFYVRNDSLQEKEQVRDYVQFALENAGTLAEEVGYISLKEEEYKEALTKLDEVTK
ncbi:PstS family phosphate ABC transporter substrate-binding protein [Cytobacillus firmus]|uniref:Phosphate-binding protein n=1 Tax=Cytobacillus firmus TaxID=1399 RepID=A0AA46PMX6_CYTFI|nr:PstS family phosphate ABC transporter substrate-binding protein [Cytobacillus firmus]UYG98233.1 PstS family phosphate ABC transporter substrate-binding protein [Cytobacillus firmus]